MVVAGLQAGSRVLEQGAGDQLRIIRPSGGLKRDVGSMALLDACLAAKQVQCCSPQPCRFPEAPSLQMFLAATFVQYWHRSIRLVLIDPSSRQQNLALLSTTPAAQRT